MTDEEFDVLDELYFVQSFTELMTLTEKSLQELVPVLENIYRKGWIKVMESVEDELSEDKVDFQSIESKNYLFLATKSGLMAHNS